MTYTTIRIPSTSLTVLVVCWGNPSSSSVSTFGSMSLVVLYSLKIENWKVLLIKRTWAKRPIQLARKMEGLATSAFLSLSVFYLMVRLLKSTHRSINQIYISCCWCWMKNLKLSPTAWVKCSFVFFQINYVRSELSVEDCFALGYNRASLLCSSCDLLEKFELTGLKYDVKNDLNTKNLCV